jgi:hypothetical protein
MPSSVRYSFSQKFAVPADAAFVWCTDYQSDDPTLLGNKDAKRTITWVTKDTVLLKDAFHVGHILVEKEKLVRIYPEQLMWISTHISGPIKYSQFTYQIVAEENGTSRLDFTALHIEHKENLTAQDLKLLTRELQVGDAEIWRRFARAMENEHAQQGL